MMKKMVALSLILLVSLPGCFKKRTVVTTKQTIKDQSADSYVKMGGSTKFDEDAEEFYLEDDSEVNVFESGKMAGDLELEEVVLDTQDAEVVQFDFDSTKIKPQEKQKISRNAKNLKEVLHEKPDATIVCDGHSCKIAKSEVYNHMISQERAEKVKKEYIQEGIPADHIKAVGHGATELITNADGKQAQSVNRRSETKVFLG